MRRAVVIAWRWLSGDWFVPIMFIWPYNPEGYGVVNRRKRTTFQFGLDSKAEAQEKCNYLNYVVGVDASRHKWGANRIRGR